MKNLASLLITICSLVLITSATVLYSEGWRVGSTSKNNNLIHKTGMIAVRSIPNNIAFLTKNHTEPGIWLLPLTGSPLNLFKNSTKLLISDNDVFSPSSGEKIWWSYDDKEVLVQMNTNGYLLYQLSNLQSTKRSEEHTSELQSHVNLVCRLL